MKEKSKNMYSSRERNAIITKSRIAVFIKYICVLILSNPETVSTQSEEQQKEKNNKSIGDNAYR